MSLSLAEFCLDLFLLGHAHMAAGEAGDGFGWERRIRQHLDRLSMPNASGFRVFGRRSLSGIYHQIDEQTVCRDATVVGEWKTYRGQIPKNDLLRFRAVTDDYWLSPQTSRHQTTYRVFGGTGTVTDEMRAYAAHAGIILITPSTWPIPTLLEPDLLWGPGDLAGPSSLDRYALSTLVRPINDVWRPLPDGGWRVPPLRTATDLGSRLAVMHHWSDAAWAWWHDQRPGRFDLLMDLRTERLAA